MTSVFFSKNENKKKVKVSVVAAQKTPKCFASSRIDCSKRFFFFKKQFFLNANHTISMYGNCMISFFSYHFFYFF